MRITAKSQSTSLWRWLVGSISIVTALLAVVWVASSAFAGGPANRPTFTSANPADYVVFNAITDNPEHGDERNFVLIREAGKGTYVNEIKLQPGKEYEVYSYFHNSAKSRLNTDANGNVGIARNARMSADVPTVVKRNERGKISTTITADNANPKKVWDEAYVTTDSDVALRYVPNSAIVHSGGAVNGRTMSSEMFSSEGAFIGYSKLNGLLPGCADYAGYVVYRLKVDQPNFTVLKQVSETGAANWSKKQSSKPDATVDFKVTYQNTGTTDQNDVVVKDQLPKGLSFVKGSTVIVNPKNPQGLKLSDGIVTSQGINIGSYGSGAKAEVTFSAKVTANNCGKTPLINQASVVTKNGTKSDTAEVIVNVECAPNECKPGIPEGDERCEPAPKPEKPKQEQCVPKDGEKVDENGNCVPVALPTTGPAEMIAGVLGIAMVSLGVAYWIRSRQEYQRALSGIDSAPAEGTLAAAVADAELEKRQEKIAGVALAQSAEAEPKTIKLGKNDSRNMHRR